MKHHTLTHPESTAMRPESIPSATRAEAPAGLRVGDDERDRLAGRLGRAFSLGYLDQPEYETRLESALTARTAGELAVLSADLPKDRKTADERAERAERRRLAARRGVIGHAGLWLAMSVLCLIIWVAISVTSGVHYFWPVWPFLGGALGVAGHALPVWLSRPRVRT